MFQKKPTEYAFDEKKLPEVLTPQYQMAQWRLKEEFSYRFLVIRTDGERPIKYDDAEEHYVLFEKDVSGYYDPNIKRREFNRIQQDLRRKWFVLIWNRKEDMSIKWKEHFHFVK